MTEEKDFEHRWMWAVPEFIKVVHAKENKNQIDEETTDLIGAYKAGLDPFEVWYLKIEIAKIEQENTELEHEKAALEKENIELDAEIIRLQKELEDIQAKVRQ